jgi:hypothetical protein
MVYEFNAIWNPYHSNIIRVGLSLHGLSIGESVLVRMNIKFKNRVN